MFRRIATLMVVAVMAVSLAVPAAVAGSMYLSKSSGKAAQTWWTQVDGIPVGVSPLGNVHVGSLYVYETSKGKGDAFAFIEDWDCEPGELPGGGGHIEFEEPSGCAWIGFRFGEGYDLAFDMDRKLQSAHLYGRLAISGGHGGPVIGNPLADVTWTGIGSSSKNSSTWRWSDGGSSYTDRSRSTDRSATMGGTIGPMGFDPDLSGGQMSMFRSMSKGRTR